VKIEENFAVAAIHIHIEIESKQTIEDRMI
jgi:hypothetical protein